MTDSSNVWRFLELGSILDPGRPAKMDKAVILSDAVRMISQLRDDAQKLRESNKHLLEKINELKVSLVLVMHTLIVYDSIWWWTYGFKSSHVI